MAANGRRRTIRLVDEPRLKAVAVELVLEACDNMGDYKGGVHVGNMPCARRTSRSSCDIPSW